MNIGKYVKDILQITDDTKIIIWGAGIRGLRLSEIFKELDLSVYAYADNDLGKQNEGIQGLTCFSLEQLLDFSDSNDICIIVSPRMSNDLFSDLTVRFKKVFPCELYELLYSIVSLKKYEGFFPIGHYYSLYPDLLEIKKKEDIIYNKDKSVLDINLRENEQKMFFFKMVQLFSSLPEWDVLESSKRSPFRYRYHNQAFSPSDAIVLHCMLRLLSPKRMIEVGSGWSSAVSLDTNEFYLNNSIDMTFIEPYPDNLKRLLKETDNIKLFTRGLQDVPVTVFEQLEAGDLLFIDSTHVSKIGSDVNYLFFEILPRLKHGVYIHLHDIFYPFEYPKEWIWKGQIWNELYLLRAFLQNNKDYVIVYFENMMEYKYKNLLSQRWPLETLSEGGSFYMKKL